MKNILSISLLNEIYELNDSDYIEISDKIFLRKATKTDLDLLKNHLELLYNNSHSSWINYFENEVIPSNNRYNAEINPLSKNEYRYTIIECHKPLGYEEEIALKISDLNINLLIVKMFTTNKEYEIDKNLEIAYIKDYISSHNLLIDTKSKFILNGSSKYSRKKPNVDKLNDFNITLKNVKYILDNEIKYQNIFKVLLDYYEINKISDESPFKLVCYFSLIESLITHNPRFENGQSISKQLSNKIELLNNTYFEHFDFSDYFKGSDSNTISTIINKLYNYRSEIAHGNISKLSKQLIIIQDNIDNVIPFMDHLTKMILKVSISKPKFINDLKRC